MENNKENNNEHKLTAREERFIDKYLESFNATRAYLETFGDKIKYENARSRASHLLKKDYIKKEIKKRQEELKEEHDLYMESLIEQLKRISFLNIKDVVNIKNNVVIINDTNDLPTEIWSCIKSIKEGKNGIEIEFHDKLKAIEMLVKYCNLYSDKIDLNNNISFDFSIFEGKEWEEIEKIAGIEDWKDTKGIEKEEKKDG